MTIDVHVEEHFYVVGGERLRRHYDFVQVTLHQLCDHIISLQSSQSMEAAVNVKQQYTHTRQGQRFSGRLLWW